MKFNRPFFGIYLLLFSLLLTTATFAEERNFLISSDQLADQLEGKHPPIILEIRYHPHRYLTVGHIPNAIQVQRFSDLGDNLAQPIMRFPTHQVFQQRLRRWGINQDSQLVLYDDASTVLASRLYVMLKLYGFNMDQVKILNGGTIGWTGFNELTKAPTSTPKKGNIILQPADSAMLIEWMDIYREVVSLRNDKIILVDARPKKLYTGKVVKNAIQAGHIPGAINIVSLDGVEQHLWKSSKDLSQLYDAIPKDKTVYLYCHDGFRMSLAYIQLKSLGYQKVRLLNGGWTIWDNAMTLPVITGDKAYNEDYEL